MKPVRWVTIQQGATTPCYFKINKITPAFLALPPNSVILIGVQA
jgi:hypothetical protein